MIKPSTYTAQYAGKWHAGFTIGNQSFVLSAFDGTEKEAKRYAEMLEKALGRLEEVELVGNDYDCLLSCTGCQWSIGWHMLEDIEPMDYCPKCRRKIKR